MGAAPIAGGCEYLVYLSPITYHGCLMTCHFVFGSATRLTIWFLMSDVRIGMRSAGAMDFDVELDDAEEAFRMVVVLKPE